MPKALTTSPSTKSAGAGAGQRKDKIRKGTRAKKEEQGSDAVEEFDDDEPSAARRRANTSGASHSGPKKEAGTQAMEADGEEAGKGSKVNKGRGKGNKDKGLGVIDHGQF